MEWVEVRGESIEAAEELALDQLGVAREDAEFEVVQESESRWLGLKRTEARVRARVRPSSPPPKNNERRNRRGRKNDQSRGGGQGRRGGGQRPSNRSDGDGSGRQREGGSGDQRRSSRRDTGQQQDAQQSQKQQSKKQRDPAHAASPKKEHAVNQERANNEMVPVGEQQQALTEFLDGLIAGFGVEATSLATLDDDTLVGSIDGADVGLLIGPRAGTLRAIQELARTAMQRQASGRDTNRLVIDVGGYRERRRAALVAFTQKQAQRVLDTGTAIALEPMGSADRKVVHDAAADIDGVSSRSAGDDPRRYVVLQPAE